MGDYVWQPDAAVVERANVTRLARAHGLGSYSELLARSREEIEWFWPAVIEDLDIPFSQPYRRVLDTSRGVQWPTWFEGGRINIADVCVHRHTGPAIVFEGEEGVVRTLSYGELSYEVKRVAAGLRALGVHKGDAVGMYLPMIPE